MGGRQSVPKGDDSHQQNDCGQHCGFLGNVVKIGPNRNASLDLIGSPEPETPMHTRRKRAEVAKNLMANKNDPFSKEVRSSRYGGLEKEVEAFQEGAALDVVKEQEDADAIVHEGPVSAFLGVS